MATLKEIEAKEAYKKELIENAEKILNVKFSHYDNRMQYSYIFTYGERLNTNNFCLSLNNLEKLFKNYEQKNIN